MMSVPCDPVFSGWQLAVAWCRYALLYCVPVALVLRLLISALRARAVQKGDFPQYPSTGDPPKIAKFWEAFWYCFGGDNRFKEHSDLWIPFAITIIELMAYPVLMVLGKFVVIGGWIGVKTAGGWVGWRESRTSFNRFLLSNLAVLLVSYFWLTRYVSRLPC